MEGFPGIAREVGSPIDHRQCRRRREFIDTDMTKGLGMKASALQCWSRSAWRLCQADEICRMVGISGRESAGLYPGMQSFPVNGGMVYELSYGPSGWAFQAQEGGIIFYAVKAQWPWTSLR